MKCLEIIMRLLYDPIGDVLDVIFDESLQNAEIEKAAYRLRDGFILYFAADSHKLIQLTVVNYRRLTQLPVVEFTGWQGLKKTDKNQLLPILASPALMNFLKLDPRTGFGHLSRPNMLEVFSIAA